MIGHIFGFESVDVDFDVNVDLVSTIDAALRARSLGPVR
jgi:hypothetical protein